MKERKSRTTYKYHIFFILFFRRRSSKGLFAGALPRFARFVLYAKPPKGGATQHLGTP